MKKIITFITAICMTVCMLIPEAVLAEDSGTQQAVPETSETVGEIAKQIADPDTDPFDFIQGSPGKKLLNRDAQTFPESFDLRNDEGRSYVTPVKFQNPFGNCWGFAAIAAAETSILGNSELSGDYVADIRKESEGSGKKQMDLSEKQLTYFARVPINDKSDPQNGEGVDPYVGEGEDPVSAAYNMGAHAPTATSLFASGVGPVLESEDSLFEYRGKKGLKTKQWVVDKVTKQGKYELYCYDPSDDWSLDESYRFTQSYSLKESYLLPSPAAIEEGLTPEDSEYHYNAAGTNAIKEQLLNRRAVQIGYKDDTINPLLNEEYSDYINNNWAHYTFIPESPVHAVCIVGYDDNYPKENFRHESTDPDSYSAEDTVPPENGAWLVKNSWGSGDEEFPNKGEGYWGIDNGSGYFWLSYYDKSIGTPEALAFDKVSEDTDIIDQHDLLPVDEYHSAHSLNEIRTANVFKAGACEEIKAVSCETTYPDTEVTFEIYLLVDGFSDPTDGILVNTATAGPFTYGGFHKIDLEEPVMVMRGQSYSVVVTQKVPQEDGSSEFAFGFKGNISGTAVINEGESYVLADGIWNDFSDKTFRSELLSEAGVSLDNFAIDNFPIKAYAKEKPDTVLKIGTGGFGPADENGLAYANMMASLTDSSDRDFDFIPEWSIAQGGEEMIEMRDGRDPSRKTIVRKKAGTTYVCVSAEGIGTAVYKVKVEPSTPWISKTSAGKDSLTVYLENEAADADGLELSFRPQGDSEWRVENIQPDASSIELTDLVKGKKYEVKLRSWVDTAGKRTYGFMQEVLSDVIGGESVTPAPDKKDTSGSGSDTSGSGTVKAKKANTIKANGKTVKIKYSKLKRKKRTIKRSKAITVKSAKGKVTYAKKKGSKKITVNKKTGKITVKKGLKKGTYKVVIKVTAAGNSKYKKATKKVTVKIKVK